MTKSYGQQENGIFNLQSGFTEVIKSRVYDLSCHTVRAVKYSNRLPAVAEESLSLGMFKTLLDKTQGICSTCFEQKCLTRHTPQVHS